MTRTAEYLAIDVGASTGRVLLGSFDGTRLRLDEIHRFDNGPVDVARHLHWDVLRLWSELKNGLARYSAAGRGRPLGIGIDTWGVDFALLDRNGTLLGNPYHYRDRRTQGVPDLVARRIAPEELYVTTGSQTMSINTLYQLYAMRVADDPRLTSAAGLLMMPDLFHYWLTGEQVSELTIASTTQMLHAREQRWATELMARLDLPAELLRPLVSAGQALGRVRPDVAAEAGLAPGAAVYAVGCHDTASAVAAVPGLDEGSVYISSGTWSLVGVERSEPILSEAGRRLDFTNEQGVAETVRILKNVAGLWLLQECRRCWRRSGVSYDWPDLVRLAHGSTPFRSLIDPDAAEFVSPSDMLDQIRSFCRRTAQPEPSTDGEVVRCCLESLALRYATVVDELEQLTGHRFDTVRIVGGGSRNELLDQLTADACGRLVVAGPVEATALGNVVMQAIGTGVLASVDQGRRVIADSFDLRHFEPTGQDAWREPLARFRSICGAEAGAGR